MKKEKIKYLFLSLRPGHWLKNLLVFMPLLFAKQLLLPHQVALSAWAFGVFCAAASSIYLFNDLIDLPRDKHHPFKKNRPVASGRISATAVGVMICFLSAAALAISRSRLNEQFFLVLMIYYGLGILYTLWLKHLVILDVFGLSAFYILRILGGIAAIHAPMSYWMILCIGLLAMFIGFNKRRHEIKLMDKSGTDLHRQVLSKYEEYFIDQMVGVITAATAVSYTLYTVDTETVARFGTHALVLTVPFVYYGIFRYLYIIHRKGGGGEPVEIFFTDIPMILNSILWILACAVIIYMKGARTVL